MKKIIYLLLLTLLAGCMQKQEEETIKKNNKKSEQYQDYFENDRYTIEDQDIVYYGVTGTGYYDRYTIYSDGSIKEECYCNYRDEGNSRVSDSRIIYVDATFTQAIMVINNEESYLTQLNDTIIDELDLLTKEQINNSLNSAYDFTAYYNDSKEENDYFKVVYKDVEYTIYDLSYVNAEYTDTFSYSIPLDNQLEGFLSIEMANEYNNSTVNYEQKEYKEISSDEFLDLYNSFEG